MNPPVDAANRIARTCGRGGATTRSAFEGPEIPAESRSTRVSSESDCAFPVAGEKTRTAKNSASFLTGPERQELPRASVPEVRVSRRQPASDAATAGAAEPDEP
jgi:hypothetical protein